MDLAGCVNCGKSGRISAQLLVVRVVEEAACCASISTEQSNRKGFMKNQFTVKSATMTS